MSPFYIVTVASIYINKELEKDALYVKSLSTGVCVQRWRREEASQLGAGEAWAEDSSFELGRTERTASWVGLLEIAPSL